MCATESIIRLCLQVTANVSCLSDDNLFMLTLLGVVGLELFYRAAIRLSSLGKMSEQTQI